jgi:hypothetical protein
MTKHSLKVLAAASIVSVGMLAIPATASAGATHAIELQGKGKGQDKNKGKDKKDGKGDATRIVVVDRDGHHRIVRDYVSRGSLPPGLAKRRALPPGLARQLRENGDLPPGLQDYFTPVPQEIVVRFPALPPYYQRHFAGDDFVVVDTRTNRIVLLIRDLLR